MTTMHHGLSRYDHLVRQCLDAHALNDAAPFPQIFGRLFPENPITGDLSIEQIVNGFDALIESMRVETVKAGPADAGLTFFGQFVDHDITLDAQSAIGTRIDPRSIRNIRTPNLDLDCIYGDGPEATPFLYSGEHEGFMLMGCEENPNDLPRNRHGRALIGDPRNDENIIISQIQGAFIQLHNILMSHVEEGADTADDVHRCAQMGVRREVWQDVVHPKLMGFEQVRRFIRLHYQWIVLNELLPAFVDPTVVRAELEHSSFDAMAPIMPAEFSGAAYRFGHATVQPSYKLTKGGKDVDLFDMVGFSAREPEHDIEMRMFFDVAGTRVQKALPVGTSMASTLFELPDNVVSKGEMWEGHEIPLAQARKLGLRNVLRDRSALKLASGQQAADRLGLASLPAPTALIDHHIDKTPLWFYCLQEASELGKGRLTGVGGRIVASVLIRLLRHDPESVLNLHHFEPWSGFGGSSCTMGSIMTYVEDHRDDVHHKTDLYN